MNASGDSITERQEILENSLVISADDVAAGYREHTVWKGADFRIGRGEFVAIIGPNGAGKTTLFRLLLGLQHPTNGTLKIFDSQPRRGNPRVGYVPQNHVIDTDTNIESAEIVRLAASAGKWGPGLFSHVDQENALKTLDDVGASDLAHRPLGQLSGGELQRVFLAEALVSNPDILLLDEPLSNLDLRREKELIRLVDGIVRSRKVTALLIAHHINPLLPYLDRVIYIANARIASGRPSDVLTSENLSALYGVPIEVLRDSRGNLAIVGIEETQDEHEV